MTHAFANKLNVELVINDEPDLGKLLQDIGSTRGVFGANGLTQDKQKPWLNYSLPYMEVEQYVIYRRGTQKPKAIQDIITRDIIVLAHSSHAELLTEIKKQYPQLQWREFESADQLDLLEMVHNGKADIALVDSTAYSINRFLYPRARFAFDLGIPKNISWAFLVQQDDSLQRAANQFLIEFKQSGQLDRLIEQYFTKKHFDEGGALTFAKHIQKRLPQWEKAFRENAKQFELDWLLLVAMGYQESHWNPNARSYTGVRGLMMLTQNTAKELGVEDRTDLLQSIFGGAKYLKKLIKRIPKQIKYPDRVWMALASYNVGYGHLLDARKLTKQQGGNPDLWKDVEKRLPLLSQKYYSTTKHGYARIGNQ